MLTTLGIDRDVLGIDRDALGVDCDRPRHRL
jgi:hypothetical protein